MINQISGGHLSRENHLNFVLWKYVCRIFVEEP